MLTNTSRLHATHDSPTCYINNCGIAIPICTRRMALPLKGSLLAEVNTYKQACCAFEPPRELESYCQFAVCVLGMQCWFLVCAGPQQGLLAKMLCAYIVDLTVVFRFFFMTAGRSTVCECYCQFAVWLVRMLCLFLECAGFVGKDALCLHC
jgi:hypothetical protein